MHASQSSNTPFFRAGPLRRALGHLVFLSVCVLAAIDFSAPLGATDADPHAPVVKYDGPGDAPCLHDASRICPSTATLMAEGRPVEVPALPPTGLAILGLLIMATTAWTLNKQQKKQGSDQGGDGPASPRQATS